MRIFPNLSILQSSTLYTNDPFIVQREHDDDEIRDYVVFNGVEEYLKKDIRTCHEVFISPVYINSEDFMGHPAFDIDMSLEEASKIGSKWEQELEKDILSAMSFLYPNKKFDIEFVWLISGTTTKVSRHLVLQGITFLTWRQQMKSLIKRLTKWNNIIDKAVYRKKGNLRLPYNRKRGKDSPLLVFKNKEHSLYHGLVKIYNYNRKTIGTILEIKDISLIEESVLELPNEISESIIEEEETDVNISLAVKSFSRINRIYKTGLEIRDTSSGKFIQLNRIEPGKCPISSKMHDRDGAYLILSEDKIRFGCHRGCTISIGNRERKTIDITDYS